MIPFFRLRFLSLGVLVWLGLVIALTPSPVDANQEQSTSRSPISVADLRNADGTLNLQRALRGSVDLDGWRVTLDPQRGPVLAPNAPNVGVWSSIGNGTPGYVQALAVNGTDIYVAGLFESLCSNPACSGSGITAHSIAKWNGSSWSALDNGLNDQVRALVFIGSDLYAGGDFDGTCSAEDCENGDTSLRHVAKWNGTTWSAVGNGIGGSVYAFAVDGANLYVGGAFNVVCGNAACNSGNTTMRNVAKWNGTAWSALDNGIFSTVYALAVSGGALYAGGSFQEVCGNVDCDTNTVVNYLAKFNGTSWSALGNGVGDPVLALVADGTNVYIGGQFSYLCLDNVCNTTTSAYHVAKWNGTALSPLGIGLTNTPRSLIIVGSDLYAGGDFEGICTNAACDNYDTAYFLAKWNGTAWSAIAPYLDGGVYAVANSAQGLIAGGFFDEACPTSACAGYIPLNHITRITECAAAPVKPTLVAPANKSVSGKARPTLKWNAANCAAFYTVMVKRTTSPTGTVAQDNNLATLQYKTPKLSNGSYKWFVQACNDLGCTKSKTFKLTIN